MEKKSLLNNMKKWIFILLVVLVILVGLGVFVMKVKDNNAKEYVTNKDNYGYATNKDNVSGDVTNKDDVSGDTNEIDTENEANMDNSISIDEALNQEVVKIDLTKQVENLEINNIVLKKKSNSKVEFMADVKNTTTEFSESKVIEITSIDENGETIAIFSGLLSKLAAMEQETFVTQVLKDITMAKDFEFKIVK